MGLQVLRLNEKRDKPVVDKRGLYLLCRLRLMLFPLPSRSPALVGIAAVHGVGASCAILMSISLVVTCEAVVCGGDFEAMQPTVAINRVGEHQSGLALGGLSLGFLVRTV